MFKSIALTILKLIVWTAKFAIWLVRQFVRGFLAVARPAMRFVAFILFIVAAIALVADLTPYLDHGNPINTTALSEHWKNISPLSFTAAKLNVTTTVGEWAWNVIEYLILHLPTFIVFGAFGLLAAQLGKKRNEISVYAN